MYLRLNFELRDCAVHGVEIKTLRIEVAAGPADKVFVLLVVWVGEDFEELRISMRTADILRRAGVFSGAAVDL